MRARPRRRDGIAKRSHRRMFHRRESLHGLFVERFNRDEFVMFVCIESMAALSTRFTRTAPNTLRTPQPGRACHNTGKLGCRGTCLARGRTVPERCAALPATTRVGCTHGSENVGGNTWLPLQGVVSGLIGTSWSIRASCVRVGRAAHVQAYALTAGSVLTRQTCTKVALYANNL